MKHLKRSYLFVEKMDTLKPNFYLQKRRHSRSVISPGAKHCPWIWVELPRQRSQVPQVLKEAQCPGCADHCRKVTYTHHVLQKKTRDPITKFKIWKWTEKTLAIAYVYDPY